MAELTRRTRIAVFALGAVYLIWGSTYLAIKLVIASIPPWSASSLRYLLAGVVMLAIAKAQRDAPLNRLEIRVAAASGALLVVANGLVGVVEQWIATGMVAVIIGAMPIWMMLLGWFAFAQPRPTLQKVAGALIGLGGIALIAGGNFGGGNPHAALGNVLILLSSWSWAVGTLIQRRVAGLKSLWLFSSYQMLSGAAVTLLLALLLERPWAIAWRSVSADSWLALGYLVVFGSLVAFTAYGWLSRNVASHIVSTYALVNPIVAVALGFAVFQEPLNMQFVVATVLVAIGLAVFLGKPIRLRAWRASAG
ncbi:MAG: EamA family transporter [Steroidobacteraceae bacterium]